MTRSKPVSTISRRQAIAWLGGTTASLAGFAAGRARADGQDILRAADRYRAPASAFVFDTRISDPEDRTLELTVRVRDRTKGLVLYNAPASVAGRAILYVGRNMWVYVPGTRRALRISPQQQVLGAVAGADVARTVFSGDYSVADRSQSGERTILDLRGDGKASAYGRVSLSVDSEDFRPLEAKFYTATGSRRLKTLHYEDYRLVLGMPRPLLIRVIDHLDGDAETLIRYFDMRIEDTPDAWFQPSYLKRLG